MFSKLNIVYFQWRFLIDGLLKDPVIEIDRYKLYF